jgi:secreted trypsin-like serine protease
MHCIANLLMTLLHVLFRRLYPLARPRTWAALLRLGLLAALCVSAGLARAGDEPPDQGEGARPAIVGGEEAAEGEFPFMAAIYRAQLDGNLTQFCAGTLLGPHWVLTAAHCFYDSVGRPDVFAEQLTVVLGRANLGESPLGQVRGVARIVAHPHFDAPSFDIDIALLELDAPVEIDGELTATVDLASEADEDALAVPGQAAVATGWGDRGGANGASEALLKVGLNVVSRAECRAFWGASTISENMLCAGDQRGSDTCFGDSGGPLLAPRPEGGYAQVGITSFGTSVCGSGAPAVFTRSSRFVGWIVTEAGRAIHLPAVWAAPLAPAENSPAPLE